MVVSSIHRPWRAGLVGLALIVCPACSRSSPAAAATEKAVVSDRDLVVLPNNTAIYARHDRLVAVRREGDILWEAKVPADDQIIAPVAVALNSTAYVRGSKALHAISPQGKWLWSKALDGSAFTKTPSVNAPVTFPDSTVAVAVGDDLVRLDDKGVVRWHSTLPEGHVTASLRAGMDGALFVPTSSGLYCISPDGNVSWVRAIGD